MSEAAADQARSRVCQGGHRRRRRVPQEVLPVRDLHGGLRRHRRRAALPAQGDGLGPVGAQGAPDQRRRRLALPPVRGLHRQVPARRQARRGARGDPPHRVPRPRRPRRHGDAVLRHQVPAGGLRDPGPGPRGDDHAQQAAAARLPHLPALGRPGLHADGRDRLLEDDADHDRRRRHVPHRRLPRRDLGVREPEGLLGQARGPGSGLRAAQGLRAEPDRVPRRTRQPRELQEVHGERRADPRAPAGLLRVHRRVHRDEHRAGLRVGDQVRRSSTSWRRRWPSRARACCRSSSATSAAWRSSSARC